MRIPRIVIAGTQSGCGKTAVAAGLVRTLARRGLAVQPYKVGPDFLDPARLGAAAGRPGRNLDGWTLPPATLLELFARGADGAEIAVIEGMSGLYDGVGGRGDEGSTAEVAQRLGAPIVLVMDVGSSSRSAAATALGFTVFDPQVNIVGVVATRAAGSAHGPRLREALDPSGIPLLGVLPAGDHLGPGSRTDRPFAEAVESLATAVAACVDVDAVLHLARTAPPLVLSGPAVFPPLPLPPSIRLAVARDEAFSFYYRDVLELLEANGAQLVPFSPLQDHALPAAEGLYLGGGQPEVHAAALAANASMRRALAAAVGDGLPTYAEGGGLCYLADRLVDSSGTVHEMSGVVRATARVRERPAPPAAVTLEALEDSLLLRAGESVRAHDFHGPALELEGPAAFIYRCVDGPGIAGGGDGLRLPGGVAGDAYLHLAAAPAMAQRFIAACRTFRRSRKE